LNKPVKSKAREKVDLLIVNVNELVTLAGNNQKPRIKQEMLDLGIIRNGAIAVKEGKIAAIGKTPELTKVYKAEAVLSGSGKTVLPGFVDPHTHLVFAGSREDEFQLRVDGVSHLDVSHAMDGIMKTVKETRRARVEKLVENGTETLNAMLEHGTTTVEAKSGFGLTVRDELKILEAVDRLNQMHSVDLVPTFLGAHVVPPEFANNSEDYVSLVVNEMIPKVTEKGLAEFCDVFCEKGLFSLDQSRRVLLAGKHSGLKPKLHADALSLQGGAELAASLGAVTADHLVFASDEGIKAMADKGVIATLLPATVFSLMDGHYADARAMINQGLPLALGTGFSPNCWMENQQLVIAFACNSMKLTLGEAITAVTINAAHAVSRANEIGSLEVGKKADIVILNAPNHKCLGYRFGVNLVDKVIKSGRLVVDKEASRNEYRLMDEQKT
jgi:imidazolonepropionase